MISCSIRARRRGGLGWETLARSHEATRRTQHRDGGALLSLPPPPPPPVALAGGEGWGHRGCVLRSAQGHRPDVHAPTFGGALRGAETRPIPPSTLGVGARGGRAQAAHKVAATQGGGIQRKARIEPLVVRGSYASPGCWPTY
jgi:hypothetical protein